MDGIHRALSALIALRYGRRESASLRGQAGEGVGPAGGPAERPAGSDAKPGAKPAARPSTKSSTKPGAKPIARPNAKSGPRPAEKPTLKPLPGPPAKPAGREARKLAGGPEARGAGTPGQRDLPLDIADLVAPAGPRRQARSSGGGRGAPARPRVSPPRVDRSRTLVWSSAELGVRRIRFAPDAQREDLPMELSGEGGAGEAPGPSGEPGGAPGPAAPAAPAPAAAPTPPGGREGSSLLQWLRERGGPLPGLQSSVEQLGSSGSSSSGLTLSELIAGPAAPRRAPALYRATARPRGLPTLGELLGKARPALPAGSLKRVPVARGVLDPRALRR